jgi:hypothetical protein
MALCSTTAMRSYLTAFDLAFCVVCDEQRFNVGNLFGDQSNIQDAALLPIK